MKNTGLVMLGFVVLMQACAVLAKDVVTQQYAASKALLELSDAKSQYHADMEQVRLYMQRFAEARKQLAAAKKKAALSKTRYLRAKANFDNQEIALERAWKK